MTFLCNWSIRLKTLYFHKNISLFLIIFTFLNESSNIIQKKRWCNFFVLKNYTFIQFSPIHPFYYFIIQFSHFNSPKFNSFRISLSSKILQPVIKNHTLLLLPQSNSHNSLSTIVTFIIQTQSNDSKQIIRFLESLLQHI